MSATRKVQATNPNNGQVVVRTSKSKVYTHALVVHQTAQDSFTIPAGTYTVPAKNVRGRRIRAYQHNISRDIVVEAREASSSIWSFHTSRAAAFKAGSAEVNRSEKADAEEHATYGDIAAARKPLVGKFEVVEVEVLDEGFNAS